jgi:hypothetical protein
VGILCTGMCGPSTTDRSRKSIISTTLTRIRQTIALRICSLYRHQITASTTQKGMSGSAVKRMLSNSPLREKKPNFGMLLRRAVNGTDNTPSKQQRRANNMIQSVRNAVQRIRRFAQLPHDSAPENASRVIGITKSETLKPVYDITVDHHHAYHANGFLVSNSDAAGLMAITWQPPSKQISRVIHKIHRPRDRAMGY